MSDLAQAALISGGIFAIVVFRGYGRRLFDRGAIIFPLVMTGVFGFLYLPHMPWDTSGERVVYAIAIAIGLAFGWVASQVTKVERDHDGRIYSTAGPAFVAVWAAAVIVRLVFVWAVSDWSWAHMHFGEFMISHHISFDAIAPFFVLWALTMVLTRMVCVGTRGRLAVAPRPSTMLSPAA